MTLPSDKNGRKDDPTRKLATSASRLPTAAPPLHPQPDEGLRAKLMSLTNLRAVSDPTASGGRREETPAW